MFNTFLRVISSKTRVAALVLLPPLWFAIFIFIPVLTIPGNDLQFQLSIFLKRDYVLMAVLAILVTIFLILQIELFRQHRGIREKFTVLAKSGAGGSAAVLAAIVGTAACASCVAVLIGFLGTGTVLAVIQYRWYIFALAILIMLFSIFLTIRHLSGSCPACEQARQEERR